MVEVLSCNVQRSEANQTTILEIGARRDVDVILIQEPKIYANNGTITQTGYTLFEPFHTWGKYMKTLTFVKNGIPTRSIPRDHPEGHMTSIFLPDQGLYIHNVYRPTRIEDDSWIHQRILETREN